MDELIQYFIKMRVSNNKLVRHSYEESFKMASQFLIYKDEFVPYNLIEQSDDNHSKEIRKKLEDFVVTTKYDKQLSKFYKRHSLKRDINHIVDSIAYLIIEVKTDLPSVDISEDAKKGDFFHLETISLLAKYQSRPYLAKEENLKQVGDAINSFVLQPTHKWLEEIGIQGFDKAPERYWQVAGVFKKRIWGKLQRPNHLDKKVFLCLGVDLERKSLFYGLECLRTGTSKLSTDQIFKFDHFTKNILLIEHISLDQLSNFNWHKLISKSEIFLSELLPLYDKVIDYIWNDNIDIKSIQNQLIPMIDKKPISSNESIVSNKKLQSLARNLVISYEKSYLKYKHKSELSKKVKKANEQNESFDVVSYHLDGSKKFIKIIASKSSSISGAIISKACIEASVENLEKSYLYFITNLSKKRKSGRLYINKGRFDNSLELKPDRYMINA